MPDDHLDHAELVGAAASDGPGSRNAAAGGQGGLRWDQSRQAWVPPSGLPAAPPPPPPPRIKGKIGPHFWVAALVAVVVIIAVAAMISVTGKRSVTDGAAAPSGGPPGPVTTPDAPPTAPPTDEPTPGHSAPPSQSAGLHEVHYFAGASSPGADITIRRSSGELDEQQDLAMPLESKTGAQYLTVYLPAESEAFISVRSPSASATVWCSITVDGQTRASTVKADDHHVSTCRTRVGEKPSSETQA